MAYKLVGQNCAAQITDQGSQDGSPATGGTAVPLKALLRRVMVEDTADTADLSSLGDVNKIVQVLRVASRIEIECFVPDTGEQFASMIGHYIKVEYKPLGTLSAFVVYSGVCTGRTLEMPDGAQVERMTIECAAN